MKKSSVLALTLFCCGLFTPHMTLAQPSLTVATFNVSMEAENYLPRGERGSSQVLIDILADGEHSQVKNIAAIIQRVRPDVLLLNEFDYIADPQQGVEAFLQQYLAQSQAGQAPLVYPYYYYNTVNTGVSSPFDLDNDGKATGVGADAWGYGFYPGQYGMLLLSKYPIDQERVRTFQHFKWRDMPGHLQTRKADGSPWYAEDAWQQFPLSSKSHWDIPLRVEGKTLHILASHPTPPVFDGPEDRNGKRNHDELRFWADYLQPEQASYIYDDKGIYGGLAAGERFIIMGDLNASADGEGDALQSGILSVVQHPKVNASVVPNSVGGAEHSPDNPVAARHTASWRMRADYVLPSQYGIRVYEGGVFWPSKNDPDYVLVGSRDDSSDHRLVWLRLQLTDE